MKRQWRTKALILFLVVINFMMKARDMPPITGRQAAASERTTQNESSSDLEFLSNSSTSFFLLPSPPEQGLVVNLKRNPAGKNLEFVHIPKTGGSAVEMEAAKQKVMWGACQHAELPKLGPNCKPSRARSANTGCWWKGPCWHQPPDQHPVNGVYQDKALFAVVRNPYTRIISEYYCPWRNVYRGPNRTEETLNEYIRDGLERFSSRTLTSGGMLHILSQSTFVFQNHSRQQVDHVLFYEDLSNQMEALMGEYNMTNIQLQTRVNEGSSDHEKRLGIGNLWPATIARVNAFYQTDFDLLGYRKLDPQQIDGVEAKWWAEAYDPRSMYM